MCKFTVDKYSKIFQKKGYPKRYKHENATKKRKKRKKTAGLSYKKILKKLLI